MGATIFSIPGQREAVPCCVQWDAGIPGRSADLRGWVFLVDKQGGMARGVCA